MVLRIWLAGLSVAFLCVALKAAPAPLEKRFPFQIEAKTYTMQVGDSEPDKVTFYKNGQFEFNLKRLSPYYDYWLQGVMGGWGWWPAPAQFNEEQIFGEWSWCRHTRTLKLHYLIRDGVKIDQKLVFKLHPGTLEAGEDGYFSKLTDNYLLLKE